MDHIYTIIIYDDAMNVFKKPNSNEFKMLFQYRHFKTTYILMMQSMKGLLSEVKSQIGGLWLFGGYNRQQFNYMLQQINIPIDKEVFWNIYKKTPRRQYYYIHFTNDGIDIILVDENGNRYLIKEE